MSLEAYQANEPANLAKSLTNTFASPISELGYAAYSGSNLDLAARDIRQQDGICVVVQGELVVFEAGRKYVCDSLTRRSSGRVEDVEGMVLIFKYALYACSEFTQLGPYLLLPDNQLLSLDVALNDGVLLTPNLQRHELVRLCASRSPIEGLTLLYLSPSGNQCRLLGPAEIPDNATEIFTRTGVRGQGGWVHVGFEDGSTTIWPAELCFFLPPGKETKEVSKWWSAPDPVDQAYTLPKALSNHTRLAEEPQKLKSKEGKKDVYPTPPDNVKPRNEDEEDNLDITDADFDFFDDPKSVTHEEQTNVQPYTKMEPPDNVMDVADPPVTPTATRVNEMSNMTTFLPTAPLAYSSPIPQPPRTLSPQPQSFSHLFFYPEPDELNFKYSIGGCYFCPANSTDSSASSSRSSSPTLSDLKMTSSMNFDVQVTPVDERLFVIKEDFRIDCQLQIENAPPFDGGELLKIVQVFADQHAYSWPSIQDKSINFRDFGKVLLRVLPRIHRLPLGFFSKDMYRIPPPKVLFKRNGGMISMLPTAVPYWERFSCEPLHGAKRIVAFILYPNSPVLAYGASVLLERLNETFSKCELGKHSSGSLVGFEDGLIPINLHTEELASIRDECERFGKQLSDCVEDLQNLVVYLVNPFTDTASQLYLSRFFLQIKKTYLSFIDEQRISIGNNLVFKILPAEFVAKAATMPQTDVIAFCREMYDRCAPEEMAVMGLSLTHSNQRLHSPNVQLVRPPPSTFSFQLSTHPSQSLLHENTYIHLAYAVGSRWVTCAWTDEFGEFRRTDQICLARRGGPVRDVEEIIQEEIWQQTLEIVSISDITWNFVVCKVGSEGIPSFEQNGRKQMQPI